VPGSRRDALVTPAVPLGSWTSGESARPRGSRAASRPLQVVPSARVVRVGRDVRSEEHELRRS
jgi:hypothetical protein